MMEFKINEYIKLKLENDKTYIYVNGKRFIQCMHLFIQIPPKFVKNYDKINSIDEASKLYKKTIKEGIINESRDRNSSNEINYKPEIKPEEEFWGHCSNIQAWTENEYDTRLLHSNISFPLLKKLVDIGDPKAKRIFKEEIAERFLSGYLPVMKYLVNENFFQYFTIEEIITLIDEYKSQNNRENIILCDLYEKAELYSNAAEIASKIYPRNAKAYYHIANKMFFNKNYRNAIEIYKKAYKRKDKHHIEHLILYKISLSLKMLKQFKRALKYSQFALIFKPRDKNIEELKIELEKELKQMNDRDQDLISKVNTSLFKKMDDFI